MASRPMAQRTCWQSPTAPREVVNSRRAIHQKLVIRVETQRTRPIHASGGSHTRQEVVLPVIVNLLEESPMKNLLVRFVRNEDGQDLIEYSLLAALIAVACIAAMTALAVDINEIFAAIGLELDNAPVAP
jgi:pilus assembly protein Flp/PilA